jgi:CRP-like cAMP-binding protein
LITIRHYASGEAIVREHESGEAAFLIERGKVEVTRQAAGKSAHLAFLEAGATFGEMGLVDDSPRSASVTAVEETLVREIHRDNIYAAMQESPEAIIKILKDLFERLREANTQLARLEEAGKAQAGEAPGGEAPGGEAPGGEAPGGETLATETAIPNTPAASHSHPLSAPAPDTCDGFIPGRQKKILYSIEGNTPQAIEAMSDNPFKFSTFPIKIGRKTNDPLVNNHLEISDQDPLQISRHHVSIVFERGKLGVMDRGSQLGALVDGVRVGGKKNGPGPVFFQGEEGTLVLGTDTSPYRYLIRIVS